MNLITINGFLIKKLTEDNTYPIRGLLKKHNSNLKSLGDNYGSN